MHFIYAIAIGIAAGLIAGGVAARIPMPALAQSVSAVFVASALGSVLTWVLFKQVVPVFTVGYLTVDPPSLVRVVAVIVAGALFHWLAGAMKSALPWVARHRVTLAGCAAGMQGAVTIASIAGNWLL